MLSSYQNTDYLAVRIHATGTGYTKSIHVAFLVDISESMNGERLACVKRTLHAARQLFADGDRITMVTFGSAAAVVANNLAYSDLDAFYSAVDGLGTAGGTNLSAGIEKLCAIKTGSFDSIVLLTDGQINHGVTSVAALNAMMQVFGAVPVTALGYGADHNQVLMRDLGLRSRGSYIYVDSESMMPAAMGDLISGLRAEVLQKATIRVPVGLDSLAALFRTVTTGSCFVRGPRAKWFPLSLPRRADSHNRSLGRSFPIATTFRSRCSAAVSLRRFLRATRTWWRVSSLKFVGVPQSFRHGHSF